MSEQIRFRQLYTAIHLLAEQMRQGDIARQRHDQLFDFLIAQEKEWREADKEFNQK